MGGKRKTSARQSRKREKMGVTLEEPTQLRSYPSTAPLTESDFLTAEEAATLEEKVYGKRGTPANDPSPLLPVIQAELIKDDQLNDPLPDFLQNAAKAGPPKCSVIVDPPLDALGRKKVTIKEIGPPAIVRDKLPSRSVTIMKDHDLSYPDLYIGVHILPDPDEPRDMAHYARMFVRTGSYLSRRLEDADLVVFSGGSDVNPALYGEERHDMTYYDTKRDERDNEAYDKCRELGIPMLGVCRGAQFLHVRNGGKLYQDIDNHYGAHPIYCPKQKLRIDHVSSVHHQAVMQNIKGGMEILATCAKSQTRWKNPKDKEEGDKPDIEAFFYRDTGCFGVQGHPEYMDYNRYTIWVLEMINDLFLTSPDFSWNPKRLRMTPSRLTEGQAMQNYVENNYSGAKEV